MNRKQLDSLVEAASIAGYECKTYCEENQPSGIETNFYLRIVGFLDTGSITTGKQFLKLFPVKVNNEIQRIVPDSLPPFSLSWRTDTVNAFLKQFGKGDYSAAHIAADALQDAGCESELILSHLRSNPQPGNWFLPYSQFPGYRFLGTSEESFKVRVSTIPNAALASALRRYEINRKTTKVRDHVPDRHRGELEWGEFCANDRQIFWLLINAWRNCLCGDYALWYHGFTNVEKIIQTKYRINYLISILPT